MGIKFLQNIDAESNKFEEAGFEVVDALPTNNLFIGRQVTYNNSTYRYNGVAWRRVAAIADRVYPYQCNVNLYSDAAAGAIIIRTPISSNNDVNNSMTYLEVSVYTHVVGEAMAKYLIYYYEYSANDAKYNKLSYSVIGSPVFENVRIGYYNNDYQCIVLGNFDKTYRYHVVLNVVATGFRRMSDDTDGFEIIRDAEESNYTNLWEGYGVQFAYARGFKVPNGTATQMLMADGSTKDISGFASSDDIPTQLPNPNPIIIKTADGVSVRYDGSASGGVILEAGENATLTATQDSLDTTMTVKFDAVVPTKLPNPQALTIRVVDDIGASLGSDILYDGLTAKILKLVVGYGIELNSVNLTGGQAVAINLKQIAGTTLLGNANGTTGTPQAITMAQLRTMLGSLMLNDISITLGGNSSYTLPCYIDYNGTRYQCRISKDATGLQIYRNGVWTTVGKFCRCSTRGTITNSNLDGWYKDGVFDYEMDESVSADLYGNDLTGKFGTSIAGKWTGKTVTLNLASVSIKDTKSAWEMLKKNMGDCFPRESVEKIRYYYNVAIPSGEVVTKIELSYNKGVGMCTVHFYTEG